MRRHCYVVLCCVALCRVVSSGVELFGVVTLGQTAIAVTIQPDTLNNSYLVMAGRI